MKKEEAEILMARALREIPQGVVILVDHAPQEGGQKEIRITNAWKGVNWEDQIGILGEVFSSVLALGIVHHGVDIVGVINRLLEETHRNMKAMGEKK